MNIESNESLVDRFGRRHRVNLVLRCQENRTDVIVQWKEYLGLDHTQVITRVDSDDAVTQRWNISTSNEATFHPSPVPHIRRLMEAEDVLYQVTPYGQNPKRVRFNVDGLSEAIGPLREACSW